MATEYYVDWEDKTYTPRVAAALPTQTFYSSAPQPLVVEIGDEEIEYGHLPEAHTDGDIYVWLKQRNVLATGGVVTFGAYPVIDHATGGWIGGLVDATKKLLDITNADTIFVPADGPAQPRAHLQAQLEMLTVVRERIENLMRDGRSIAEMLDAGVTAEFDGEWGANRERFVANIYHGLGGQGGSVTRCDRQHEAGTRRWGAYGRRATRAAARSRCPRKPSRLTCKRSSATARNATTTRRPPASYRSSP